MTPPNHPIGRNHSRLGSVRPINRTVLDRHDLIAALAARDLGFGDPSALLLLIVLDDPLGAVDPDLTDRVGLHLGAMIRDTDLIGALDPGELAMVVFDLPVVQREAFVAGITMALDGVMSAVSEGVVASIGTSRLRSTDAIALAFRAADRTLDPIAHVPA